MMKVGLLKILKAATVYFVWVFGAGFLLGVIRVLLLVPRVGVRYAELIEAPIMLVITIGSAGWVVKRFEVSPHMIYRLTMGMFALAILIAMEFTVVLAVRGLTLSQYFNQRDPVSGTVYYLLLLAFALMPSLIRILPGVR
jgi:hypothetical protein